MKWEFYSNLYSEFYHTDNNGKYGEDWRGLKIKTDFGDWIIELTDGYKTLSICYFGGTLSDAKKQALTMLRGV